MMIDRQDAARQYQQMGVQTATPGKLILMLYEGGLRFLDEAAAALQDGQMERAHATLLKAQNVVAELASSLNQEAGDLSTHLGQLYGYMHGRLVDANVNKDVTPIREVAELLQQLRDAWAEMLKGQQEQADETKRPGESTFKAVIG